MNTNRVYDHSDISKMLPHKHPFLLVDQAFDVKPGESGYGIKCITGSEWYLQGHFPGNPIVPGVMIVESLAQLCAVIYISEYLDTDDMRCFSR